MFQIGLAVVLLSILVGFIAEGGNIFVLFQPYAALIVVGSALGIFIISNPKTLLTAVWRSIKKVKKGSAYSKRDYINLLIFLFFFFKFARTKKNIDIETHIEKPFKSQIFKAYPEFLYNREALVFLCDYMRMLTLGYDNTYELDNMMFEHINVKKSHGYEISHSLFRLGDTLPALGIVAAVLGVINAMASIHAPPEIMGQKIASALVGTFFGVAAAYCVANPLAAYLEKFSNDEAKFLECIKAALLSHAKGNPPSISIEFARQVIPNNLKPGFYEIEKAIENYKTNKKKLKYGRRQAKTA